MSDQLVSVAGSLLGVLVGYWLGQAGQSKAEEKRAARLRADLRTEIKIGRDRANQYLNRTVDAPSYRMPDSLGRRLIMQLNECAGLNEDEMEAAKNFFDWLEDINRCLDKLAGMDLGINKAVRETEIRRIDSKCQLLVDEYYPSASKI